MTLVTKERTKYRVAMWSSLPFLSKPEKSSQTFDTHTICDSDGPTRVSTFAGMDMKTQQYTYECSSPLQKQKSLTHARAWMRPQDIRVSEMYYTEKGTSHVRTFSSEVLPRTCGQQT